MTHNSTSQGSSDQRVQNSVLFKDFFSSVKKMRDRQIGYQKVQSAHNKILQVEAEMIVDKLIWDVLSLLPNTEFFDLTKPSKL